MQKFSENIHHKNISLLCRHLESWRQSRLSSLGVTELGYSYYDIKRNDYLVASTNQAWRYEFLEEGLENSAINLLQRGTFILPSQSRIKQQYNKNNSRVSFKTVFVFRNTHGFEMFGTVTQQELTDFQQMMIKRFLWQLSHELHKYKKSKSSLYTPMVGLEIVREKHMLQDSIQDISYQKARFNDALTLTAKEQRYLEHLLFQMTHKEIAHQHGCSETAVRKVIINIKRKLGCPYLSSSEMMRRLKHHGVLGMFNEALV